MGTVTFQNTESMMKVSFDYFKVSIKITILNFISYLQQSSNYAPGTIAFILDEEALLVRVNKGWQYIAVSNLHSNRLIV